MFYEGVFDNLDGMKFIPVGASYLPRAVIAILMIHWIPSPH